MLKMTYQNFRCVGKIFNEISLLKYYKKKVYFLILRRYNMTTSPSMFTKARSFYSMHNVFHVHVCFIVMLYLKIIFMVK